MGLQEKETRGHKAGKAPEQKSDSAFLKWGAPCYAPFYSVENVKINENTSEMRSKKLTTSAAACEWLAQFRSHEVETLMVSLKSEGGQKRGWGVARSEEDTRPGRFGGENETLLNNCLNFCSSHRRPPI